MHTSLHKIARKIRIPKGKDLKWEYGNLFQFTEKIFEIMMSGELQGEISQKYNETAMIFTSLKIPSSVLSQKGRRPQSKI